jgi:hypothetical protein
LNTQKIIYEGDIGEWACHPNGILMRKDDLLIFHAL